MQSPEPIICPNCKNQIKLEYVIHKKQAKIHGIKTNDIFSYNVEVKSDYGYIEFTQNIRINICNHCRTILGTSGS